MESLSELGEAGSPVGLVRGVEAEVGDVRGVQAGEALHLVPEAAVLVPSLQQLPPHRVEALVVVLQQLAVPVAHLRFPAACETLPEVVVWPWEPLGLIAKQADYKHSM